MRTCDGLAIDQVIFSGYTPFYDKGLAHEREKLRARIHKTALGAEETVAFARTEDIFTTIAEYRSQAYCICALEQGEHSINLAESSLDDSQNIVLILGEEVHGVPQPVLDACDCLLEIPMLGHKESFNVSVAAAIAIWELRKPDLKNVSCQS